VSADDLLRHALTILASGERLPAGATADSVEALVSGEASSILAASFLTGLRVQVESADQIVSAARVLRKHSSRVPTHREPLVDTCGTGGDGQNTFSISTAAALVAAGAGAVVAKHGNRGASGNFGGADTLEALGVAIELPAPAAGRCLDEAGIAFLFARRLHPVMRHVAPIRSELKIRTIFNLLGPLINPAGVRRQVIGVPSLEALSLVAEALVDLEVEHALVVHSRDGLDEISLAADNDLIEVRGGRTRSFSLSPADLNLPAVSPADLRAPALEDSVRIVRAILAGEEGPQADVVAANAGAALYVAGIAETIAAGVVRAQESIQSGAAADALKRLVEISNRELSQGDSA
jgi:anthranilate phosphoribosyltransferase